MQGKRIRINTLSLIAFGNQKGGLKDLAAFLYLKTLYKNSCIYNYSQERLAQKSGFPLSAIKRHIRSFTEKGWCRKHRGNLVFVSLADVDQNKKKKFAIVNVSNDLKQLYYDLCHLILKLKQSNFDWYKQLRSDLSNALQPAKKRHAQRIVTKLNLKERQLPSEGAMMKVSIKTVSEYIGCSVGSAAAILKRLLSQGKIFCMSGTRTIMNAPNRALASAMMSGLKNATYFHNKKVILVECNSYQF